MDGKDRSGDRGAVRDGRMHFVFAPRGTPAPLGSGFRHPGRRTAAAPAASLRKPLEAHNCFFNLLAFFSQLGEDFAYIHTNRPLRRDTAPKWESGRINTIALALTLSSSIFPPITTLFNLTIKIIGQFGRSFRTICIV